jgi:hypothetical protein
MHHATHVELSLDKIRVVFHKASSLIEDLKPGEKIPATKMAENLAAEIIQPSGEPMTGAQLYPTLKFLFDGYPNVKILRGAHGGILKLAPPTDDEDQKSDSAADDTVTE